MQDTNLIEKFTNTIPKGSKNTYRSNIKYYIKNLEPDPEHDKQYNKHLGIPLSPKQETFLKNYFNSNRDYKKDIEQYHYMINDQPAKSIKSRLASIKSFMQYYDVELPAKFWKQITKKTHGSRAVTIDRVPTREELKKILSYGTVKDRALFLTLSSSGMRIGETCKLTLNDIDLNAKPAKIIIRREYTKSGNPRITFISNEATEALKQWLSQREDYLKVAVKRLNIKRTKFQKKQDDNRIFPFSTDVSRVMWNRLTREAGYNERDPSSNWHSMHIHCLRKYFSSHMNVAGMQNDIVESFLGHEEKLNRIYNIYNEQQLADFYQISVNNLTVFESKPDLSDIHKQLEEKDKEIMELKNDMQRLMIRILSMEDKTK